MTLAMSDSGNISRLYRKNVVWSIKLKMNICFIGKKGDKTDWREIYEKN